MFCPKTRRKHGTKEQEAVLKATAVRSPEQHMFHLKTKKRNLSVPAGVWLAFVVTDSRIS